METFLWLRPNYCLQTFFLLFGLALWQHEEQHMWYHFPFSMFMPILDSLVKFWLFSIFLVCVSLRIFPNWTLLKLHLVTLFAFYGLGFPISPQKLHMVVLLGSPFNRLMEKSIESFYCKLLSSQNSFIEQSGIEMRKQVKHFFTYKVNHMHAMYIPMRGWHEL